MKSNLGTVAPAQCRAGRALVDWSQDQLSAASAVSISALRNFEAGRSNPTRNNIRAIRAALEAAGVEFTDGDGVRLTRTPNS